MKTYFYIIFLLILLSPFSSVSQCNHTIDLYDSYGDGWNGGTVTVTVNGTAVLTNITLASGSGPDTYTFSALNGQAIQVTFFSGSYPEDCYYDITGASGALLADDWYPNTSGPWNGIGVCPAYASQWISMDIGLPNWCAGETRDVKVTVKNNGTATWTDSSPDVNIGCKWDGEADYFVRVHAAGLVPGAQQEYTLSMTAPAYAVTQHLTFDVVKEGDCWFGNNNGNCGPGNSTYISSDVFCGFIQPTSGTSTATITCGSSKYFYDSGGPLSDYYDDENGLITICPSSAGEAVSIDFSSFSVEEDYDYLYVFDGDNGTANIIGVFTGVTSGIITASSDNSSGCLSFRFLSDGGVTESGWTGLVTCTSTPAAPYPTPGIEDCKGATVICSDATLSGGTNSYGNQELPTEWDYCLELENESNWYAFSPQTSGNIEFTITPASATDYDWAIWGPYSAAYCPAFTNDAPLRCSGTTLIGNGNTGLSSSATDTIEQNGEYVACCGEVSDGFLKPIYANAGEIFIIMIDNWSASSVNFDLEWNLNGGSLDCDPVLPVTLTNFNAQCDKNNTTLYWTTQTEINNNFFIIEKSYDLNTFTEIGKIYGSGSSNSINNYSFVDSDKNKQIAYYRLLQVDYDGSVEYHRTVASDCINNFFEVTSTKLKRDNLEISISADLDENIDIYIYDNTGKLIVINSKQIIKGNNSLFINGFNISSGIYLLSINGEINHYSEKLFVE